MYGFTENYIKVETPYNPALANEVRRVKLLGWNNDHSAMTCTILPL